VESNLASLYGPIVIVGIVAAYLITGIKIIRPVDRLVVETLGKFTRIQKSGITIVLPYIQKAIRVNITERMIDVQRQEVITKDNLNCIVDAQIYFKVGTADEEVKASQYRTFNFERQIVQLAKTTLRNVIGDNLFRDVNSNRAKLNLDIYQIMENQTKEWGVRIVRVELKEVEPPKDVQETMNMVIKAENEKQSAIDFANAVETKADGDRRASIQEAEGIKQSSILKAEGEAEAIIKVAEARAKEIEVVNQAAEKYFVGNAQELKRLEVTQASLQENSKVILTEKGISPTIVINETRDTIIPTTKKTDKEENS